MLNLLLPMKVFNIFGNVMFNSYVSFVSYFLVTVVLLLEKPGEGGAIHIN